MTDFMHTAAVLYTVQSNSSIFTIFYFPTELNCLNISVEVYIISSNMAAVIV